MLEDKFPQSLTLESLCLICCYLGMMKIYIPPHLILFNKHYFCCGENIISTFFVVVHVTDLILIQVLCLVILIFS